MIIADLNALKASYERELIMAQAKVDVISDIIELERQSESCAEPTMAFDETAELDETEENQKIEY